MIGMVRERTTPLSWWCHADVLTGGGESMHKRAARIERSLAGSGPVGGSYAGVYPVWQG